MFFLVFSAFLTGDESIVLKVEVGESFLGFRVRGEGECGCGNVVSTGGPVEEVEDGIDLVLDGSAGEQDSVCRVELADAAGEF